MKLNPDCIRDILLCVEDTTDLHTTLDICEDNLPEKLSDYSFNEIVYHVKQCELSGLFGCEVTWYLSGDCEVPYLSPDGHDYISSIRSHKAWSKTKEIAGNIGANSIDTIKQIAVGVFTSLIQNQLVLH